MAGKLNIFQKTLLQWNTMYPYNAVHLVRVPLHLDKVRLTHSINSQLENCGLTGLSIDDRKGAFHYYGGPALSEIKVVQGEKDPRAVLREETEEQLNMPFTGKAPMNPFRFFAVQEENAFYLGLVYFHVIAGAESIVFLLKRIVNSYMDKDAPGLSLPLSLYPRGYFHHFKIKPKPLLGWLSTLPSFISELRKSFRPPYTDRGDQSVGVSFFSLEPDRFHALVRSGKRWGVTLNDIFLALLLKAISPFAQDRKHASRRKMISVASIVNIRRDLDLDMQTIFGVFLGSFIVSHAVPEGIRIEDLVRDIHRQTDRIKKYQLYIRTTIGLALAQLLIPLFSPLRQRSFYPKYYPLWAGITNINLNVLWKHGDEDIGVDYFRAVSTGPVSPLVFSITTVNDVLNIGVSFKTSVFSQEDVDKVIATFLNSIDTLRVSA
ncbi:MAG TPA: hypothetical protein DCP92_20020 [Nitrospiraceae bacterium]|nr:hypothetical protein [Nitrospiraceae bacterium]